MGSTWILNVSRVGGGRGVGVSTWILTDSCVGESQPARQTDRDRDRENHVSLEL